MQWQATYVFRISTALADLQRNTLADETSVSIEVGSDSTPPELQFVGHDPTLTALAPAPGQPINNVGWETDWPLAIRFDEGVDPAQLSAAVALTPTAGYELQWSAADELTLLFDPPLEHGTIYTLSVDAGVADMFGNATATAATYRWQIDGPLTLPPAVADIGDDNGALVANFDVLTIDGGQADYFDFYIAHAAGATPSTVSFLQHLQLVVTAGTLSPLDIVYLRTELNPVVPAPARALNVDEHLFRVYLDATAGAGLVQLELGAGFADTAGNPLAADWQMTLNS